MIIHLDPLWADPNIDFIGIDNYMPLSDWRDGEDHLDAAWGDIGNPDYLRANVAGGEGYDWFYDSDEARSQQRRTPITDGAHDEPWVFRYKDLVNWWRRPHHERIGGVRQAAQTDWVPESKPVWFTEYGCAAVDKATNQPNVFYDPKSSESHLPYFSNGMRDEVIQRRYLRAVTDHWADPANNPVSTLYGGAMVDMSRAFVWAWDARPYPWFPNASGVWSDGPNWRRGHWITGRVSFVELGALVREICAASGLTEIDVSDLRGVVRGYVQPAGGDARRALQPLMLAYGFDAIERDGKLVFRMRDGLQASDINKNMFADHKDLDAPIQLTRAGEVELSGRVRLGFVEADGDHRVLSEETVLADEATHATSDSEVPLTLTRAEARQTVERWLAEARIARDTLRFALPPSRAAIGAGDVVRLTHEGQPVLARIDRVERGTHQLIEAVRIDPEPYRPLDFPDSLPGLARVAATVPVLPLFMDLPLLRGDEEPHQPHLAVTARPWPGTVALYSAADGGDFTLDLTLAAQAVIGVTRTPLRRAPSGRADLGAPLEVVLTSGTLQSVTPGAFLAGGNGFAIGDGTPDGWEVFQARDVQLVGERTWHLSHRLRGQAGTDALMPEVWPAGSYVVALNAGPVQVPLSVAQRGLVRQYRVGPASESVDSPLYEARDLAFAGNGLRPYAPVHGRAEVQPGGHRLSWIRRGRIDADGWEAEIPLGEEREAYRLRLSLGGTILREVELDAPGFDYTSAMAQADGALGVVEAEVRQLSARFGPGPALRFGFSVD